METLDMIKRLLKGDVATYIVDKEKHATISIDVAENIGSRQGITREEYLAIYGKNGMDSIHPNDRSKVWDSIMHTIEKDAATSICFRVIRDGKNCGWVNATYTKYGEQDGMPLICVLFTPVSIDYDLQLQALSTNSVGVYVADANTYELYYVNEACFQMRSVEPQDYIGKKCYEVFHDKGKSCEYCIRNAEEKNAQKSFLVNMNGRTLSIILEQKDWNDRKVVVVTSRDVTEEQELKVKLEQANEQLQDLVNHVPGGVCLFRWDGEKLHPIVVNEAFSELYGTDGYRMMVETDGVNYTAVHPDDLPGLQKYMKTVLRGSNKNMFFRYRVWNNIMKDYIWVSAHANSVQQDDGTLLVYITYTDVTKENEMQHELADAQNATSIAMEYGNIGLWIYDMDTRKLEQRFYTNGAYGSELIAENIPESYIEAKVIHEEDAAAYAKCYQDILDGKEKSECKARVYDKNKKKYFWSRIYLIRQQDSRDGKRRAIGFSIDIDKEQSSIEEMTKSQAELRELEATREAACAFADMWVFKYDLDADRVYVDKRFQKDFGFPQIIDGFPEAIADYKLIFPEYVELYMQSFRGLKNHEKMVNFDIQSALTDGSTHWIRFQGEILPNVKGQHRTAAISAQIVDAEKTMEARAELERKRMYGNSGNMLFYLIVDLTDNVVLESKRSYRNKAYDASGLSYDEIMSRGAKKLCSQRDREEYEKNHERTYLLEQYRAGMTEFEYEYQISTLEQETIWGRTNMHLIQDASNGHVMLYEYIYDISAQKLVEELVKIVLEDRVESIGCLNLHTGNYQILEIDQETGKTSARAEDYFALVERRAVQMESPEEQDSYRERCSLEQIQKAAEEHKTSVHKVCIDGEIKYERCNAYLIAGEENMCILTRADVTSLIVGESKKNEELAYALKAAQAATQAKSEFLSRMSHEIRTPMNAIMGMTAIAKENKSDFLQVSDCLNKIDLSSHYLLTLLNDILEMSRIESGKTELRDEEFDFAVLMEGIRTIVETLASKNDIRYECINKANLDYFYKGDRMRIQQVMVNIITNAIKFTRPGGRVRFTVECEDKDDDQMIFHFAIADTGIGMSDEFREKMFKPFTQEDGSNTSKYQGSGLGLAISKNLIELMGGSISVVSFLGVGSTFKIDLPLKRMKKSYLYHIVKQVETAKVPMKEEDLKGKKILMAEDHPMNVMIAKKLLENKGMVVAVANNGKAAVEMFQQAAPSYYDAILMDIRMPVMDGIEATKQIRLLPKEDAKSVPIIAMTANALEEDRRKTKEAGMNAHLAKPFEPKQLYTTLMEWIQK